MNNHLSSEHNAIRISNKYFKCKKCQHVFSLKRFDQHQCSIQNREQLLDSNEHDGKYDRCPFCNLEVIKGRIPAHILKAHPAQLQIYYQNFPEPGPENLALCPFCKAKVNKNNLFRHIRKVHPDSSDLKSTNNKDIAIQSGNIINQNEYLDFHKKPQTKQNLEKKPEKRIPTRKKKEYVPSESEKRVANSILQDMTRDWIDVNTSSHGPAISAFANKPQLSPAEQMANDLQKLYVHCPICYMSIYKTQMGKHMRQFHSKKNNSAKKKNLDTKNISTQRDSRENIVFSEKIFDDSESDGSRNDGRSYRDFDGTFGSYPLHDDYSDESDAD